MHTVPFSMAGDNDAIGLLFLDGLAGVLMLYALARLIRAPREWFSYGRVSKALWSLVSLWLTWHLGETILPAGAMAALWHLRSLSQRHAGDEPRDLPFATGTPVNPKERR
jgi:hypothetical protein